MIDLKNEGEAAYRALSEMLEDYRWLLEGENPAIRIFLSGDRPIQFALADPDRLMGIDGRPSDLGQGYDADFIPVISQRYGKVLNWNGRGPIPSGEREKLASLVAQTHAEGKRLRLWASPETEEAWQTLLELGVDLINTDRLEELDMFLMKR
ncbi:MAG: hypothetical protein AAFQ87_23180 [Bacteroidota bacterium]